MVSHPSNTVKTDQAGIQNKRKTGSEKDPFGKWLQPVLSPKIKYALTLLGERISELNLYDTVWCAFCNGKLSLRPSVRAVEV